MATLEDVKRFWEELDALEKRVIPGTKGITTDDMTRLVRESDPEVVMLAVRGFLLNGQKTRQRGHYQRAYAVADLFHDVTGDDNLVTVVAAAMTADGFGDAVPTLQAPPGANAPADEPEGMHWSVTPQMLAGADAFPIIHLIAFEQATSVAD